MTSEVVTRPSAAVPVGEGSADDLYEHAPCGYLSTSMDGTIVKVNATFSRWIGHATADLLGSRFTDLLTVGSRLFYDTRCQPTLRLEGEIREVSLALRRAGGHTLPVLVNSVIVTDDEGRPRLVRTAVFDATGRQDYERDLLAARRAAEQSEARVLVLQQASTRLSTAKAEADVTAALADVACTAFDATSTAVLLLAPDGDRLVPASATDYPLGPDVPTESERPESQALRLDQVVGVGSLDEAERLCPQLVEPLHVARFEAMTAAPLLENGEPFGVLVCFFGRRRDFSAEELDLQRALTRQSAQVLQRVRLQERLRHLAQHDPLTGLANRQLLDFRLQQVLSLAEREGRPLALVFLDLDGFKPVNDLLGHATGDRVLVQVAQRLQGVVRGSDTVARFGGDEFVIVCDEAPPDAAAGIAERVLAAVRQPLDGVPPELTCSASIGVARYQAGAGRTVDRETLVREADAAMYASKNAGKNRITVVDV